MGHHCRPEINEDGGEDDDDDDDDADCDDNNDDDDESVENDDNHNDNPSQCKSFDGSVRQRTKPPWNGLGQEHSGGEFVLTIIRWFGKFGSRFS